MTQYLIIDSDFIYKLTVEGDPNDCESKVTLGNAREGEEVTGTTSLQLEGNGVLRYIDLCGKATRLNLGDAHDIYLMMTYLIRHARLAGKTHWYKLAEESDR